MSGNAAGNTPPESCDLVIVGAGPAGMSAAVTATRHGAKVLVLDENATPGGQIYRALGASPHREPGRLGASYVAGRPLLDAFMSSGAPVLCGATVWGGEVQHDGIDVAFSANGVAHQITAKRLLLATGAMERPMPVPGWTLPGVMTAGAAQTLLKASAVVPAGRVVLAGNGPLLYLLAQQLLDAGADIAAVLDTTPRTALFRALPALPGFLASPYFTQGLALLAGIRQRCRLLSTVSDLAVAGDSHVESIRFRQGRRERTIPCDTVLLHQGVVPNINFTSALGCEHRWDDAQRCWHPVTDEWGRTTQAPVLLAGDGAGIGGAMAAEHRGTLAALAALTDIGRISRADQMTLSASARAGLARAMRGRRFLDLMFQPARAFVAPPADETIACRCEEVRAGEVRRTAQALDVQGPNQMKAFLRCGMGPCQGRMCAITITELIAETRGCSPAEVGAMRHRMPVKPVTLGEIAGLPQTAEGIRVVMR